MGQYFQQPLPPPEEPRKPRGRRRPRRERRTSPVIYILAAIGFVTVCLALYRYALVPLLVWLNGVIG